MDPFDQFNRSESVSDLIDGLERQIHYKQPVFGGRTRERKSIERFPVASELRRQKEAKKFGR